MAERIVSPGVFTQERDQSFLAEGVAQIGAAFIGQTTKGPAFIPTQVLGIDGFVTTYGEPVGTSYTGYAVKNYLQEAGSATVVRVLGWTSIAGTAGYTTPVANIYVSGSAGKKLFATLHPNIGSTLSSVTIAGTTASFSLLVSGAVGTSVHYSGSGLSTSEDSPNFISSIFGTSPVSASLLSPAYTYAVFPNAIAQAGTGSFVLSASTASLALTSNYSNATTPWVRSQTVGGLKYNLFRLHTLNDGVVANTDIKISITGISTSTNPDTEYGTFTILVRKFDDEDNSLNVLEEWSNLTLDPESPNYIARRIGNSVPTYSSTTNESYYEGDFQNLSKYIRVELSGDVVPASAIPYGFGKLTTIVNADAGTHVSPTFVTTRWVSGSDKRYYYGYDFSSTGNLSYLAPLYGSTLIGSEFNIEDITTLEVNQSSVINSASRDQTGYRRFSVPFQAGFDGFSPSRTVLLGGDIINSNTQGFDLTNANSTGSVAYKRALDAVANPDNFDLNLLVVPGVLYSQHPYIAQAAIDLCEQRGDCFYLLDLDRLQATISEVTTKAEELDTNYAAVYYPWVRVLDTNTNKYMWAPPSVVLPEVYAYSDNVGAEWFAPAGLNRGGIPGAVGVKTRLNQAQRDELYESKVNPIAQFPGQGITVWGQKTLQRRASALDRVNVRRLLITVKKYIASSARYLVFEQNTEATRNRFLNIVNPYLAGIQQRSGLTAFRVVMDETNNTPDIIDRNILVGSIYLQPTRTAEFIKLDFNILPTGATFDTI
jgi:hypothetical protein